MVMMMMMGHFTPGKTDPSNIRDVHEGSKWGGSPPAKKACRLNSPVI